MWWNFFWGTQRWEKKQLKLFLLSIPINHQWNFLIFKILIFYLFKFLRLHLKILLFFMSPRTFLPQTANLMQFCSAMRKILSEVGRRRRRRKDWTEKPERNLQWMSSLCEMNSLTYPFQVLNSCSFIKVLCKIFSLLVSIMKHFLDSCVFVSHAMYIVLVSIMRNCT